MRKIVCVFLISLSVNVYAQQPAKCPSKDSCILDSAIKVFQDLGEKLKCDSGKFVTAKSFNEIIKQVFARVIIRNDDLVKNGTATSIKIDDKDKTISGNANFKVSDWVYWNIGVGGKTESKSLSFFQGGAYSKGFTVSTGFDFLKRSSIFYDVDSCEKLHADINRNNYKILKRINDYLLFDTLRVQKEIDSIKNLLSVSGSADTIKKHLGLDQLSEDSSKTIAELVKKEDSLKFFRNVFGKFFKDKKSILNYLKGEVSKLEVKNAATNGYTLHWINTNFTFLNQDYNIFDTSVTKVLLKDTLNSEYFRQYKLTGTYNYVRNSPHLLWFWYAGLSAQNQYGLQDFIYKNDTLVGGSSAIVEKSAIEAVEVTKISTSYNKAYFGITPQFGTFAFFGKSKIFGLEAFASMNCKFNTPELIEYRPTYSFRFGALFSLSKSDGVVSDGTLGLIASVNNYVFGKEGKNFGSAVAFGFRLGIPFSNIKIQ